jgi:hypothetical protein
MATWHPAIRPGLRVSAPDRDRVTVPRRGVIRGVCAREGVGIVRISDGRIRIFDHAGEASGALMAHLDAPAGELGHPEVRTAPWLTAGRSAGALTARNAACWKPERTVCAISPADPARRHPVPAEWPGRGQRTEG